MNRKRDVRRNIHTSTTTYIVWYIIPPGRKVLLKRYRRGEFAGYAFVYASWVEEHTELIGKNYGGTTKN